MKNKKLFAILTLLCFMMTLMPVAAFADVVKPIELAFTAEAPAGGTTSVELADGALYAVNESNVVNQTVTALEAVDAKGKYVVLENTPANADDTAKTEDVKIGADIISAKEKAVAKAIKDSADIVDAKIAALNPDVRAGADAIKAEYEGVTNTDVKAALSADTVDAYNEALNTIALDGIAGAPYAAKSTFATVKSNLELDVRELGKAVVTVKDINNTVLTTSKDVYIWAETANGEASAAFVPSGANVSRTGVTAENVYKVDVTGTEEINIAFTTADTYSLKATLNADVANGTVSLKDAVKINLPENYNKVKVNAAAVDSEEYTMHVNNLDEDVAHEGETKNAISVKANNVTTTDVTVGFTYKGNTMAGLPVTIDTNSASIEVDETSFTTNHKGEITFAVSGTVEGTYKITVNCQSFTADILVKVGNTAANDIEVKKEPKAPIALNSNAADFKGKVQVVITDVNGNAVVTNEGVAGASDSFSTKDNHDRYVAFTEKPAASKLKDKDIRIEADADKELWNLVLASGKTLDAEGTYTVKIALDNGRYVTVSFEVKKFQKPVELKLDYNTTTVELGGSIEPSQIVYVDENGVEKKAADVEFAATGYAIAKEVGKVITVKSDEKYVGAKITATVVSDKYNLVDSVELTVAEGASEIAFADKTAEVNVNNKIVWNIVDSQGNKVALNTKGNAQIESIKYVVLDKPEGAKVSAIDTSNKQDLVEKGEGKMSLTSNKIGNVTVQAIVKAVIYNSTSTETAQTKYYTGTQIFAVGNGSVGDVVVMSIGSNEIIVNDAKATIDAAPMVQNDRTYVPFRALAEAFGAEVAYDEATQAVTAELNGVKVVMTIGSATYTVNDAEKTMDVAPFINGSRTMVPVRFAAEAFGIKVIPTYDENGATADILFNL